MPFLETKTFELHINRVNISTTIWLKIRCCAEVTYFIISFVLLLIYGNCKSNNSTIFICSVHLHSFLFQKWPLMDYELITTAMTIYRTMKVHHSQKIFMEEGKKMNNVVLPLSQPCILITVNVWCWWKEKLSMNVFVKSLGRGDRVAFGKVKQSIQIIWIRSKIYTLRLLTLSIWKTFKVLILLRDILHKIISCRWLKTWNEICYIVYFSWKAFFPDSEP